MELCVLFPLNVWHKIALVSAYSEKLDSLSVRFPLKAVKPFILT
jgi:hypothetical protein